MLHFTPPHPFKTPTFSSTQQLHLSHTTMKSCYSLFLIFALLFSTTLAFPFKSQQLKSSSTPTNNNNNNNNNNNKNNGNGNGNGNGAGGGVGGGGIGAIPGFGGPGGGFGIPGFNGGNGGFGTGPFGGGYGGGFGTPTGGYSKGGVIRPTVVCKEKGRCYGKKLTCPAKCFTSYSRSGKNYGGGGGGGGCTVDCKKKCVAYC